MLLLTKENREKLPPLYAQEEKADDAIVHINYFTPWSNWTWYVTEGSAAVETDVGIEYVSLGHLKKRGGKLYWMDKDNQEFAVLDIKFFGLVQGFETEWGYFVLSELESVRGPFGLGIERDLYFDPTTIGKVKEQLTQYA